ncbi:MAG TPA: hypothetical protein PKV96_00205 [Candidatus Saccharimonas sp.]|jgi:hypothetical protein|nr:hypothetical protein [Candidatus Saccharimonas sp.]
MNLLRKKQQAPARRGERSSSRQDRATDTDLAQRYAFRRNRTLTGSLVSHVSSANEQHALLKSHRAHAHDLKRHRKHLGMTLFAVLCGLAVCGFLVYQSIAVVRVVAATTMPIDESLYAQKIQSYLAERPLERFRFALDTGRLTSYLQLHGCPEVSAIAPDVLFAGFGTGELRMTIREPAVAWKTGTTSLYVDDSGTAFERNYYSEPAVKVVDQTGIVTRDNKVLASNRFLAFIGRVIGQMKAQGYHVNQVDLPAGTSRQVAVLVDGISYPIKFSVDRPVGEQAEDAGRSIRYLAARGIVPAEYLDIRISQKAFYK